MDATARASEDTARASEDTVTLVIERSHGREHASIIYGHLPSWLTVRGAGRLVYTRRLDREEESTPLAALYTQYQTQRDADTLPLSDVPRVAGKGGRARQLGPEHWWKPVPLPRGQDWTP